MNESRSAAGDFASPRASVHVDEIIDSAPLNSLQISVALVSTLILIGEGIDLQILSYLMPQIVREWGLSTAEQSIILTVGYLGTMLGYLGIGSAAARFGLKRTVIASLLGMGTMLLLSSMATDVSMLVALRFLTGFALGGVVPPVIALTTEYYPTRLRSSIVTMIYVGIPLGLLLAGSIAWLILPTLGWRFALGLAGCIAILLAVTAAWAWPESLEFLINRGRDGTIRARNVLKRINPRFSVEGAQIIRAGSEDNPSIGLGRLFEEGRLFGTLVLWALLIINAMVYYLVLSWLPLMLVKIGATQQDAILASAIGNGGGILAAFVIGPLMDRFNAIRVIAAHFAGGGILVVVVGMVLSPALLPSACALFCLGYCVSGLQKGISALTMLFYPTELRSPGLGWVMGVGRVGAILGPAIAGVLIATGHAPAIIFMMLSVPFAIGALLVMMMARRYQYI